MDLPNILCKKILFQFSLYKLSCIYYLHSLHGLYIMSILDFVGDALNDFCNGVRVND
jgi:hypothetical protein